MSYLLIKFSNHICIRYRRWIAMHYPNKEVRLHFWKISRVQIGDNSEAAMGMQVIDDSDNEKCQLIIGKNVSIAAGATFVCCSEPSFSLNLKEISYVKENLIKKSTIIIGDDTWIGANTTILPGVKIGKFCIIGAGSIVTKDIEDFSIAVGVPAKVIRKLKLTSSNKMYNYK
ncbi:hypothetical protein CR44_07895 [Campylobacter fetus subsp. testudinum]|nr:hypothetical protein CR44_07895 [Campylobacter fetus subsp. testudinum]